MTNYDKVYKVIPIPELNDLENQQRLSAFIVFECLETLMKHEARVYEMASPKGLIKHKSKTKIMLVFSFSFPLFPYTVETWTDLLVNVMEDVSVIFTSTAFQWETVALLIALLCYNFE